MNPSPLHLSDHQHLRHWPLWLAGLLAIAVALSWSGLTAPLVLDDNDSLSFAKGYSSWTNALSPDCFGLFRPFKSLVFYGFAQAGEVRLGVWHGILLGAFLSAIVLVFVLARSLFRSDVWGLAIATIWALTPTQACVAVWMSCINIGMAAGLLCAFLLAHRKAGASAAVLGRWSVVAVSLMFLAQLSYEAAVAAVGLAVAHDVCLGVNTPFRRRLARYALYAIVTLAYLVLRQSISASSSHLEASLGFDPSMTRWQLALSAPWFLLKHLLMWLLPPGRVEFLSTYLWGKSASALELGVAWLVLGGLAASVCYLRKRVPLASFGIAWFLVASFPSSNLVPIYAGPVEDYYLIIPSIGLALALAAFTRAASVRLHKVDAAAFRHAGMVAALPLVAVGLWRLSYVPFYATQVDLWNRPVELYLRSAATRPHQFHASANAAKQFLVLGRPADAIEVSREVIEDAPWYPYAYLTLGHALAQTDHVGAALEALAKSAELTRFETTIHQSALVETARIHIHRASDWASARQALLPVLERGFDPYRIPAIHLMADLYQAQGNLEKALATLSRGSALYPDDESFRLRRSALLDEATVAK